MPPTEKQKREISGYIRKWRSKLYLEDWNFKTRYCHEDENDSAAEIKMQIAYKDATITVQPKLWKEDKKQREMIICHELCHCIAQPLVQLAVDAGDGHAVSAREIDHWKEHVTQHITNSVFWAT